MADRILLSGPDVDEQDRTALMAAFDSGWIAPVGPDLNAFESELADYVGVEACVALASGTSALQLGLVDAGVQPGDEVIVQSCTFAASAFSIMHAGAIPVFCDIDPKTWSLDPNVLEKIVDTKAAEGVPPRAVMPVDLYGSCADYEAISEICGRYDIPIVEDAAEALGSISGGKMAGTFGRTSALSFNGNKIITTSGGGALLGSSEAVERARRLSTQARSPVSNIYHEHEEIGYNFRLSNLLAGLGRSQLARLETKIARRSEIAKRYRDASGLAPITWGAYATTERPNYWLIVGLLPEHLSATDASIALGEKGIEARPAWKPMHCQPVFAGAEAWGGLVSEDLFERGLCLPSGSALSDADIDVVIGTLSEWLSVNVD